MDFDMMGMEQFHYEEEPEFYQDDDTEFYQAKPAAKPAAAPAKAASTGVSWTAIFIIAVILVCIYLYMYKKEETQKAISTLSAKLKGGANRFYYF